MDVSTKSHRYELGHDLCRVGILRFLAWQRGVDTVDWAQMAIPVWFVSQKDVSQILDFENLKFRI